MLKMFPKPMASTFSSEKGAGLLTAIFVIVIVGMFGSLIARYLTISAITSAEDYHWAQALYSAQSAAQVTILYNDGGGTGANSLNTVASFSTTTTTSGNVVRAVAQKQVDNGPIQREIEVRTSL